MSTSAACFDPGLMVLHDQGVAWKTGPLWVSRRCRGALVGCAAVCVLAAPRPASSRASTVLNRALFHDVVDDMLNRHVDAISEPTVLANALQHLARSLDRYSHFTPATERANSGTLGHAGFMVEPRNNAWTVIAVHPTSPAHAADVQVGDILTHIEDVPAHAMDAAVHLDASLRGPRGTSRTYVFQRNDQTLTHTLILEPTVHKPPRWHMEPDGIAWLTVPSFAHGWGAQTLQLLGEARRRGPLRGIVLDVRHNMGGELDEALLIADAFVASGVLMRTRGRDGAMLRQEHAHEAGTDADTPLVVLVDHATASAAELLAAILQDHHRATVIGARTFGKGTVQEHIGLPDGSLLTLTIARYFTHEDRTIDGNGVLPDVQVATVTSPKLIALVRTQLQHRLTRTGATPAWAEPAPAAKSDSLPPPNL